MNTIPYGRKQGKVKFFNCQKGYGFIIPHNLGISEKVEVFVHHTAIHNNGGFKSLAEVEFDLIKGPKGLQAANVSGPNGISVKGDPNAPGSNKRINNNNYIGTNFSYLSVDTNRTTYNNTGGYGTRLGMNQAYHALQTPYFQQQMSHFASQQPFGTQQFTNFVAQAYGNPSTGQPPNREYNLNEMLVIDRFKIEKFIFFSIKKEKKTKSLNNIEE
ncbi:uncharacterized protein OCT59_005309 [Rhizophagus irregularis]|uniref:uncharacterized protein n=1 Tax=Rhizophagus irregularis TaxID=588596 RepID=UPI001C1A6D7A|nr:hypothetical protein OCT59_005309 [Rhizophagus irregularis]CAB5191859.1 unnamed protein product [Rhizophagus irregularis]